MSRKLDALINGQGAGAEAVCDGRF